MGTSQSSNGPGSGVALVPPWADEAPPEAIAPDRNPANSEEPPDQSPQPLAPPARFRDARRSIGRFAKAGNEHDLRRGIGQYVRSGYGGSATMSRRMAGTARTASRLGQVLGTGTAPDGTAILDLTLATGTDAEAVMDAIVEAVRPSDGTQDAEAGRQAMRDAMSDLLERRPDADLLALDAEQRQYVIERFTALDLFNRFQLDLGKALRAQAPDTATALRRLAEVREFIYESVAAAFRSIRGAPVSSDLANVTRQALTETLSVFEEYVR